MVAVMNRCLIFTVLILTAAISRPQLLPAKDVPDSAVAVIEPQTDPNSSLSRGRTLLKQGHADQALGYLETALNLFTQSNNQRGIAAAQDGLGDLYLIQGQYKVALEHYQKAYE